MKVGRRNKLEAQLAATEAELTELLRRALPHTAAHGDMLFFNSQYCPASVKPDWVSPVSEDLLSLASESLNLRDQLGMPRHGSPGALYIAACREAADTSNGHRRGPRQLAAWIINELGPR